MSRKHNTKHPDRSRSNYPHRLTLRGLSKSPQLPDLDHLRRKQGTEVWLDQHPEIVANVEKYLESISKPRPTRLSEQDA